MKNILYLIIVTLVLSIFSCRKELDIDIKEKDKKIVLNGLINPDSLIKINLSKSIGVLESSNSLQFVNNAIVKLYEDNNYVEDLIFDKTGNYYSTINPKRDKEYKITADVNGMKSVETYTSIPVSYEVFDLKYTADSTLYGDEYYHYYDYETTIDVSFNDPSDKTNYYILSFSRLYPKMRYNENTETYDTIGYRLEALDYSSNTQVFEVYCYNSYINGYAFSDKLFDGQKCSIHSKLYNYYNEDLWIYINLYSISKDYFKYLKSYDKYEEVDGNPFAEPVIVYSNIENGLGLFSSYSTYTDSIYIEYD